MTLNKQNNSPLVIDVTRQDNSTQILPRIPVLSSEKIDWKCIFLAQYYHPAHEIPEHRLQHHVIAIANKFVTISTL
ncbi:AraC family transcriptional regulator [Calothrix sp. NIES-4101]|nr:AraC family transcriptional regulator [Calothrix sp. NIES-4101]